MNILLFDNDEFQLEQQQKTLSTLSGAEDFEVTALSDISELDRHLAQGARYDVAIMDIDLGEGEPSGIDLVKEHFGPASGTQVVYLTGFVEYCTEVYETDHVYFLLKPVTASQLGRALERAAGKLERVEKPLRVVSNRTTVGIAPGRIVCIESLHRKAYIRLVDGSTVETRSRLAELKDALPRRFVQPHKSFLVNLDFVAELQPTQLKLAGGRIVPVSQARRKAVRAAFMSYLHSHG